MKDIPQYNDFAEDMSLFTNTYRNVYMYIQGYIHMYLQRYNINYIFVKMR